MTQSTTGRRSPSSAVISAAIRVTAASTAAPSWRSTDSRSTCCACSAVIFMLGLMPLSISKCNRTVVHRLADDVGAADGLFDFRDQVAAPQLDRRGADLESYAGCMGVADQVVRGFLTVRLDENPLGHATDGEPAGQPREHHFDVVLHGRRDRYLEERCGKDCWLIGVRIGHHDEQLVSHG